MAGYREHISVSGMLGAGYGTAAAYMLGFTPVQGMLAGVLTWVSGMLPDLDSDTGKPLREISCLVAAVVPFAMMGHLLRWGKNPEGAMLLAVVIYASIRYGGSYMLAKVSVHRGMFHSIPAMLIAAEFAYLAYQSDSIRVKALMAGGVAIGFASHLILDEMYSVQWTGLRVKLNKAAGSAFKIAGKAFVPNIVTYSLLMLLTYATLVDLGLMEMPEQAKQAPMFQQAIGDGPQRM